MELNKVRQAFEYCLTPERGCLRCPAYISGAKPCYVWNEALFYLNEYATTLHNEPLTWSELLQMLGKPIWVEYEGYTPDWEIIENIGATRGSVGDFVGNFIETNMSILHKENQGITWQAYQKERANENVG